MLKLKEYREYYYKIDRLLKYTIEIEINPIMSLKDAAQLISNDKYIRKNEKCIGIFYVMTLFAISLMMIISKLYLADLI